jgi:hypothetical protein
MKKVVIFLLIILSPISYACSDAIMGKQPMLQQFKSIMVMTGLPADVEKGEAKAVLSTDKTGRVVKAELVSVKARFT